MSDRIWITAKSELIPFEELTDEHLDNAIEWCKIRLREIPKPDLSLNIVRVGVAARKCDAAINERNRIRVLLAELEDEKSNRKPKPYATVTVRANEDTIVNGVRVLAGETKCFTLEEKEASLHMMKLVKLGPAKTLKERIDTCTGKDLDEAAREIAKFGWGRETSYARIGWKEKLTDQKFREYLQTTNGYVRGVCENEYVR